MQVVAAALHHGEYGAAVYIAEFCVGIRRDDADLRQRVGAGIIPKRVVDVLVDLLAVEQIVVGLLTVAVHSHLRASIDVALG
jgi:hypothetical protein